jgi:hypothetical protein
MALALALALARLSFNSLTFLDNPAGAHPAPGRRRPTTPNPTDASHQVIPHAGIEAQANIVCLVFTTSYPNYQRTTHTQLLSEAIFGLVVN